MRSIETWLSMYGEDHQNPTNQKIHKVCVPLIMMSLLGLLWAIPSPQVFQQVPYLNWSTLFCLACLMFYFSLHWMYALAMLFMSIVMLVVINSIAATGNLVVVSVAVFFLAWLGQFYGHKVEGKKPSFLTDLQFLLIGPLWVIKDIIPARLGAVEDSSV